MIPERTHDPDLRDLGSQPNFGLMRKLGPLCWRQSRYRRKKHPRDFKVFSLDNRYHRKYGSRMKKIW